MLRASLFSMLLMTAGIAAAGDKPIELGAEQARLLGIRTASASAATHVSHDHLIGDVQLPLAGSAVVASPYAGRVLNVSADEGDSVSAGQVLAVIASRDYAEQRARLKSAEAELELANQQLARDEALLAAGVVAASRAEASRAARTRAAASVNALRASLESAPPASASTGSFALKAPVAGRVIERHVAPGAALAELEVAFVLAADSGWRLEVAVPLALTQHLDGKAVLRVGAVEAPVEGRGYSIDSATQTVHVRGRLPADSGLLPGQRVTAQLLLPAPANALAVPRGAITRFAGESRVFVQRAGGYELVPVTVVGDSGADSVVSGALTAGETVVVSGVSALKALLEE
ncbi:MAG: efflux RND transporter periplasmic adaptor subunit [Proteobacteria bacterium]|nr:efflux RND transporter periplasmic adaptor subunit [Pseudomonadota bacterium]